MQAVRTSKSHAAQKGTAKAEAAQVPNRAPGRVEDQAAHLQQTVGNQAALRLLEARFGGSSETGPTGQNSAPPPPLVTRRRSASIQTKLKVDAPGDVYEEEADRVANQVVRTPESSVAARVSRAATGVQRKCECGGTGDDCKAGAGQQLQMKPAGPASAHPHAAPPAVPVDDCCRSSARSATRAFMEPRFRHDRKYPSAYRRQGELN